MLYLSVLGTVVRIDVVGLEARAIESEVRRVWHRCVLDPAEQATLGADVVRVGLIPKQTSDDADSASDNDAAANALPLDGCPLDVSADTPRALLSALTSYLTVRGIAHNAGTAVMLHAAASADPTNGRTIALVGPSGAGKTTASIALSRLGSYVTDETLLVREDHSVLAYPKPLSVGDHRDHGAKAQVSPDELALGTLAGSPPQLVALLLLDRRPNEDISQPMLANVGVIDAMLALAPETSYLAQIPRPLGRLHAMIRACGGVRRVTYSEASTLAAALAPLWREDSPGTPRDGAIPAHLALGGGTDDATIDPTTDPAPHSSPISAGPHVRRLPVLDAIAIEDEMCLMIGTELRKLSGVGPFLWASTRSAISVSALAEATVQTYGYVDGWEQITSFAISELVDAGVLEYV